MPNQPATRAQLEAIALSDHDCPGIHEAPSDVPYAFSRGCTWHGDPRTAARRADHVVGQGGAQECPVCGATVIQVPSAETWWAEVRRNYSGIPQYEALMGWSEGKCFPDFDHLQNAYRQAMEGES